MSGFHADPAALDALARRLEDTAAEYHATAAEIATAATADLGPAPVSAALATLTGEWSARIRAAEQDFGTAAAGVRAAATAYRAADADAAEKLDRTDG